MTDILTLEAIRRRWQTDLTGRKLASVHSPDFGQDSRARRLKSCGVRILLQPLDPFDETIQFDDAFWEWLENHMAVEVEERPIRFGLNLLPSAHAAMVVAGHGSDTLDGYLALERSGCIEVALGHQAVFEGPDRMGKPQRAFCLVTIAAYVQATLVLGKQVHKKWGMDSPVQLTVAMLSTEGARLTNLGEGWADALGSTFEPAHSSEPHLLWHIPIKNLDEAHPTEMSYDLAQRIIHAWGYREAVHLNRTGDRAGTMDLRRVQQY